jgi:hypothetical protein
MAVDTVLGEPVSGQFPAIREIYREFQRIQPAKDPGAPFIHLNPCGLLAYLSTLDSEETGIDFEISGNCIYLTG